MDSTCNFKKCASRRGHEAFFSKEREQRLKTKVLRSCGADEKERIARAIHKLKAVVYAVVPPIVLPEDKNAPDTSASEIFHMHMEAKRGEADGQRSDRSDGSEQSEVNGFCFPPPGGPQSSIFMIKCDGLILKICFPPMAGCIFSKR